MARSTPVKKAWRSLTWLLVIIVGLIAINGAGVLWGQGGSWAPKLALDLQGGTQIVLAPQLESGQTVTDEQLNQAVSIIRQRVDASGVAEAEIATQGAQNITVSIPGVPDAATLERLESSAKLEFRPVLYSDAAATSEMGEEGADPTESPTPGTTDTPEPTLNSTPTASPTDASDPNWVTEQLFDDFTKFDCDTLDEAGANVAPEGEPLITCDADTRDFKYILGPVEVRGANIADASHGLSVNSQGVTTGQWAVNMEFDSEGTEAFADVTRRLITLEGDRNRFAIVLDGQVITAPTTNTAITDGRAEISGNFTQDSAKVLADQLKFGALPIGFEVQSRDVISATLGETQLSSGIIAGLIGMVLVVIYSLFQYRLLGSVTIASLIVAGVLTYLVIAIMSWRMGFRLSLAGVAGLIVAIGFTADSFIVYFERIRDELRDGKSLVGSVEAGWRRALRTVLAAKGVNLLSAAVLFVLAIGNVRGFAVTLGVTTIIDVLVVVLFTHPMLQLLATTPFFENGHRLSGLDPHALGAVYRGRAQFRAPAAKSPKLAGASREAVRRQTIAERKAAESAAKSGSNASSRGKKS
ncbi:MAG: protein translocase subunit SecD [Homoserinimonas sp.]